MKGILEQAGAERRAMQCNDIVHTNPVPVHASAQDWTYSKNTCKVYDCILHSRHLTVSGMHERLLNGKENDGKNFHCRDARKKKDVPSLCPIPCLKL